MGPLILWMEHKCEVECSLLNRAVSMRGHFNGSTENAGHEVAGLLDAGCTVCTACCRPRSTVSEAVKEQSSIAEL